MNLTKEKLIEMGLELQAKLPCTNQHEDPSLCIDAIQKALSEGTATPEQQKHAYSKFLQYRAEAYLFRSMSHIMPIPIKAMPPSGGTGSVN